MFEFDYFYNKTTELLKKRLFFCAKNQCVERYTFWDSVYMWCLRLRPMIGIGIFCITQN